MELLLASAVGTQLLLVTQLLDYALESVLKVSARGKHRPLRRRTRRRNLQLAITPRE